MSVKIIEQINSFNQVLLKQGGDLVFDDVSPAYEDSEDSRFSSVTYPDGYKPFIISIYDIEKSIDILSLKLIINPTDIQIGQTFTNTNTYTRKGWVSQIWGKMPGTISASGICAAFYLKQTGLTNYSKKDSIGFMNLQALMSIFKNNGVDFLMPANNETYFKTGVSRVPNVLDAIKISYDSNDYLGTFNSFTLTEEASKPYNMSYTFEFIYTGLLGDTISGHVRSSGYKNTEPKIRIQGKDNRLDYNMALNFHEIEQLFSKNEQEITNAYEQEITNAFSLDNTYVSSTNNFPNGTSFDKLPEETKKSQLDYANKGMSKWKNTTDNSTDYVNSNIKYKVDKDDVYIIGMIESSGIMYEKDGRTPYASTANCYGVMQINPETGNATNKQHGVSYDYYNNPTDNIKMGATIYADELQRFKGDVYKALAAYNAGSPTVMNKIKLAESEGGNWVDYLPIETKNYISRYNYYKKNL